MSAMVGVVLVAVGGGAGAAARFVVADSIRARRASGLPWGTWWVNVLGSFVVGVVTGVLLLAAGPDVAPWRLLLATGFCGGFTTFSTASFEAVALLRGGRVTAGLGYAFGSLVVTVTAVAAGIVLVEQVVGRS